MYVLGETVKKRRQALGMSLREFGAICGVSHTHIDSIERGYDVRTGRKVNPTSATISKIAVALHIDEATLLGKDIKEQPMVTDELLKFVLFGDSNASDEMLEEVKQFAQFVKMKNNF